MTTQTSPTDPDQVEEEARGRLLRSIDELEAKGIEVTRRGEHAARVLAVTSTISFGAVAVHAIVRAIRFRRVEPYRARLIALARAWRHPEHLATPRSRGVLLPIVATVIAAYAWLRAERSR